VEHNIFFLVLLDLKLALQIHEAHTFSMKQFKSTIILMFALFFSGVAQANIAGTDLQNFNPNYNGLDFISVFSSDTLPSGVFNIGGFATYELNSMPYLNLNDGPPLGDPDTFGDNGIFGEAHAGFGIIRGWDIGVGAQYLLDKNYDVPSDQNVQNSYGFFEEPGLSDIRIATKVRFLKKPEYGMAVVLGMNLDRVLDNPFSGRDPDPSWAIDLIYDRMLTKTLRFGLNVGYRMRGTGDLVPSEDNPNDPNRYDLEPISDQIAYSLGFNYMLNEKHNILLDIFGSLPIGENAFGNKWELNSDRDESNLEFALGWRFRAHRRFDIHAGLGREFYQGLTTPDLRAWLGFNWRIGPIWGGGFSGGDSDRDGVPDSKDKCPNTPDDERKDVNKIGCADADNDGLSNSVEKNETNTLWDNPDTDGDGLKDGAEVRKYSTDPNDKDSDDDGLMDGMEVRKYKTNPMDPDTDDGGVNDGDEVKIHKTNPQAGFGNDDQGGGSNGNDNDNDGVVNGSDQCPSSLPGVQVDDLGCDVRRVKKIRLDKLNFITNTATMVKSSKPKFDDIVTSLQSMQSNIERIVVEGHTDSRGDNEMNRDLSQRRADRIAELLSERLGMDRGSFDSIGYGEDRPVSTNGTASGRLANRRVELRLIQRRDAN